MTTIPMGQCLACAWIGPITEHEVHDCIPNPKIQSATLDIRIDIHEHVKGICTELGLNYDLVYEMTITPMAIVVSKYVNDQPHIKERHHLQTETLHFKVTT